MESVLVQFKDTSFMMIDSLIYAGFCVLCHCSIGFLSCCLSDYMCGLETILLIRKLKSNWIWCFTNLKCCG